MKDVLAGAACAALFLPQGVCAETLKIAVESAVAGVDPQTAQPTVTLMLTAESRKAIGEFTKARVGEQVKMRVGEAVLSEPIIREPIALGTLVISGNFTEDSARSLADAVMGTGKAFEVDGSDK